MRLPSRGPRSASVWMCAIAMGIVACAPALNWREVRPSGGVVVAWLPCKPDRLSRSMDLAGATVSVEVLACAAEGSTWAVTSADVGDPVRVAPALRQLRQARSVNLEGRESTVTPAAVAGMTASPEAVRLRVVGSRPDGQAVTEESVLFAAGTRVFHAAVLGGTPTADAQASFFAGLKIGP